MPAGAGHRRPAPKYAQLEVGPAPSPTPGESQIVVRNHAVAINPLDWILQVAGPTAYRWLSYPTVIGSDVAVEVVEVVTRFGVGDWVLGHAVGTARTPTPRPRAPSRRTPS